MKKSLKVALVQTAPVLFNTAKTMECVREWILQASEQQTRLIIFPESFIPGYPRGLDFGTVIGHRSEKGRELWRIFYNSSIQIPGKETNQLGALAKDAGAYLIIGITERDQVHGSLFCTTLYFGPDGQLIGKHRKIKPTGLERVVWGEGGSDTLTTIQTEYGKIGGLICWENYMPLARMSMYAKGVELYVAPTADARQTWQSTLIHIACEGRCFVFGCNQFVQRSDYPTALSMDIADEERIICRGGSVIVSPFGQVIAGPLYDAPGMLFAELDLDDIVRSRLDFDVTGHYSRDDLFYYQVNGQPDTIEYRKGEPGSES
jgi:nitrilase